ncbi:MAG: DUF2116 family Zn-ribbon domain-containing protein [Sarcina sp.]
MKKNCPYCNKKIFEEENFCSHICEQKYNNFLNYYKKTKFLFVIGIILTLLLPVLSFLTKNAILANLSLLLLGLTIILFPFTTPETTSMLGVKKSILIARFFGALTILLTIFL